MTDTAACDVIWEARTATGWYRSSHLEGAMEAQSRRYRGRADVYRITYRRPTEFRLGPFSVRIDRKPIEELVARAQGAA